MQPQQHRRTISYKKPSLLWSKYSFSPTENSFCFSVAAWNCLNEQEYSMHAASSLRQIKFVDVFTAAVSLRCGLVLLGSKRLMLSLVPVLLSPASCLPPPVSRILSPASCLPPPLSCFLYSCLLPPQCYNL